MKAGSAMTRTERTYYLVFGSYTFAAFFIAPVYPLFLLSRSLDLFQMNAVLATYLVTSFVFEVPTGAFADRVGRKRSFLLGCVVRMTAYVLYVRVRCFSDCVQTEFLDAVGTTLVSGALDAWAVDGVREEGDARPPDRLLARAQVLSRAMIIVGGVACGYLAEWGFALTWFAAAAGFGVSAVLGALLMRETARRHEAGSPPSLGRAVLGGLRVVRGSPVLRLLCVLSLAGAFAGFPLHMLWQPRVQALTGLGPRVNGWVLALLGLASLVGSALLPRLLDRLDRHVVLSAAAAWRAVTLGMAAAATTVSPALAGLVLQEVGSGLSEPVMLAWVNEHVAAERRATVLSVRSAFFTLGGATGLVTIGLVARGAGIPAAWAASAAVFALTLPAFLVLGRVARWPLGHAEVESVELRAAKSTTPLV